MTVNMYREYERQDREQAHNKYMAAPEFPSLEAEALKRGYRHATLSEINASCESACGASSDLYCWRGGLWVKAKGGAA